MTAAPPAAPAAPEGDWRTGSRRARRHERRLFVAAQPAAWAIAQLARRRDPDVCHVPGLGYVVSGAEAAREVLLDGATFTKTGSASAGVLITQVMGEHALLNMDGAPHVALRRRIQDLFTPRYVDAVSEQVLGGLVRELRDRLDAGEQVDLAHFAHVYTGTMLCHLNGLELEGAELEARALELYRTGAELARLVPLRVRRLPRERVVRGRELFAQLVSGTDRAWRRGAPETIPGRLREIGLSLEEARGVIGVLMLAGTETTSTALTRIVALLADTGQWARLRAHPELLGSTIDEGLRVVTPVPAFTRTIERDHVLRGRPMRGGRLVLVLLANACRDPRVIDDGGDFDIGRSIPRELRHLTFGAGPHFCLGFNMARRQLAMVLEALAGLDREIEVVRRRAARDVLLPTYREFVVQQRPAAPGAG